MITPNDMRIQVRESIFGYRARCTGYLGLDFIPYISVFAWTKEKAIARARAKGFKRTQSKWKDV